MTTKAQEREILAKIRKLIESAGADSYIAIAFEGCIEDAEQNIEYDMACSMKQRLASAERKIETLKDQLAESEKDYEAAHAAAHEVADEKNAEIEALKAENAKLRKKIISVNDMDDCMAIIRDRICEYEEAATVAAEEIVKYAVTPECKEFQNAVRDHRNIIVLVDAYKSLRTRIETAISAGA